MQAGTRGNAWHDVKERGLSWSAPIRRLICWRCAWPAVASWSRAAVASRPGGFLRCWTLLYGAVSMEVFGHMSFALTDPAPMFEITLGDLAALIGLQYPLPR